MNKKLLALLLVVLLSVVCVGGATSAYAFSTSSNAFDKTDVLQDLDGSVIAGKQFDVADYPKTDERQLKVIAFIEYCYTADINEVNNYGLYVYVYNPSGKKIVDSAANKLQMCVAFNAEGKAITYDKYTLQLCDVSDGEQSNLFYKFKLVDSASVYPVVYVGERRYDVSGIELKFKDQDVTDYAVGNSWIYTGFSAGCGVDKSTLLCRTDSVETVELDVDSTYYRYNNSVEKSVQISSVWFGVEKRLLVDYGVLQKIKASWFEAKSSPMVVLNNYDVYTELFSYRGKASSNGKPKYELRTSDWLPSDDVDNATWAYNGSSYFQECNRLDWLFYSTTGKISSDEVLDYAKSYPYGNALITSSNKYSSNLFVSQADEGRIYGQQTVEIDADSVFTLDGFSTGKKFWDWYWTTFMPSLETDTLNDIEPIYEIKAGDMVLSDSYIADKLYVDVDDVKELKDSYYDNLAAGKKTYLFRFAVTDYVAKDLAHADNTKLITKYSFDSGYVAWQTVFLDFDVISLTFVKDDVETVVPAVSDPIDIFGGLTPPPAWEVPWWIWALLAVIVLVLLCVIFKPVFEAVMLILKAVWFLVSNFFLGWYYIVEALVNWIKGSKK